MVSDPIHVLCGHQLSDDQLARLRAVSPRLIVEARDFASGQEFEAALEAPVEVLFTHRSDFDPQHVPQLRWLQTLSAGVDHLHTKPIWHSSVAITSANGVHAVQIGEYVLTMLLAHGHHLPMMQRLQMEQRWAKDEERQALMPNELRGMTVGIIGYGAIGREVARLATNFGMQVIASQRGSGPTQFRGWTLPGTGDPDGGLPRRFYPMDQLHELLWAADAVVLTLPLTEATHHLIDASALSAMQSHALLINIGRGAIVDQAALIQALQQSIIGGAALDVTDPEPLPSDNPLWTLPNVILTPHISGMSRHYDDRAVELFSENLRRYIANEPLLNLVRREEGY